MSFVSDLAMKGTTKLASIPPDIFAAVITDYIENGTPSYKSAHGEGITEKLWGEVGVWFSCGTHARIDADAILAEWLRLTDNQDSHKAALVSLTEEYFKRAVAAASNPASLDDLESFDMIFDRLQSLGMMDLMKGKMRGVIEPLISGLAMTPAQEELASNLLSDVPDGFARIADKQFLDLQLWRPEIGGFLKVQLIRDYIAIKGDLDTVLMALTGQWTSYLATGGYEYERWLKRLTREAAEMYGADLVCRGVHQGLAEQFQAGFYNELLDSHEPVADYARKALAANQYPPLRPAL